MNISKISGPLLGLVAVQVLVFSVIVAATQPAVAARPVSTDSRTYVYPKIDGTLVDRCLYWGKQCDWPAAHKFCRLKGFDKAVEFQWAYKSPTRILGSGQVCNVKDGCGAISRVRCVRAGGSAQPSIGVRSGKIVARIERKAYDCKEAGRLGAHYVICQVSFSLKNTSGEPIRWASGKWETAKGPEASMDRRQLGYRHVMLDPGNKEVYTLWCHVPKGQSQGTFSAWGSGAHPSDADKHRFTWRVTTRCP